MNLREKWSSLSANEKMMIGIAIILIILIATRFEIIWEQIKAGFGRYVNH
ncbi:MULTISPECIES: hypothetical protein [Tenuifilum]|jgi:cell division protein FtsL|nr:MULTISPECIES: hypothetical protein [Tenuifilum]